MSPETSQHLQSLREHLEQTLKQSLELPETCPEQLALAMQYSLLAGGKRLRPVLVLLACEACGGSWKQAIPAACAIEMIHTYSLIHDDLPAMDDDDLRRGQPTSHIKFGEATAILAGDGLLTRAFEVLAGGLDDKAVAAACCVDLANAAGPEGMVGGQQADLEAETAGVRDIDHLEAIHRRKTGRLLCASLTMGGRIAGASPEVLERLRIYGESVGLAFQIADDLLDEVGDEQKMGKGVRKDASHGKLTYPALLGLEASRQRAVELIDRAVGALEVLGDQAKYLREIASYVIHRDH
ncbi:MAG: polyprenyl synthetase family protein [Planctomycetaceae bacterium]|nr:polyprenyl synthetase family protein [Planctomycetaceae bacterium]